MSSRPNAATVRVDRLRAGLGRPRVARDGEHPVASPRPPGPATSSFAAAASSSGLRAVIVTDAPRLSSSAAMAWPMPRLAPVTSAARPRAT